MNKAPDTPNVPDASDDEWLLGLTGPRPEAHGQPREKTKQKKAKKKLQKKLLEETSFAKLELCCSFCGTLPEDDTKFKCCAACGITRYCGPECQREAWKRTGGNHKGSCGNCLPTPAMLKTASALSAVSALQEFGGAEIALVELCLARIVDGVRDPSVRRICIEAGAIAFVVRAMEAYESQVAVQTVGCTCLGRMALGEASNRQAMKGMDVQDAIVAGMRAHTSSLELQQAACLALRNISLGAVELQQAIVAAGGAVAVIAAIYAHCDSPVLCQEACAALSNLCGADSACQQAVVDASGAQAVVFAMKAHPRSESLLAQGCGALGNMAGGDAAGQRAVVAAGGADAVAAAFRAHPRASAIERGAKAALANMVWDDGTLREAVLAAGADVAWLE